MTDAMLCYETSTYWIPCSARDEFIRRSKAEAGYTCALMSDKRFIVLDEPTSGWTGCT